MSARLGKNPYRPGVGTPPLYLAGREAEKGRFLAALRAAPEIPANVRLTGLRGVGKTVLLAEFQRLAEEEDWAAELLELEPRHNAEHSLAETLTRLCKARREKLSRMERLRSAMGQAVSRVSVAYGDLSLSFDPTETEAGELSEALFSITKMAIEKGREGFVLLLDEAQIVKDDRGRSGEHPLSLLISAVTALQKEQVPLGLVLCGLPTLAANLLQARTYSERMFRGELIGSLEGMEARKAFLEPLVDTSVVASRDLVDEVMTEVEGYPYFIQLWGAELWDAAETTGLTNFSIDLLREIERDIYRRLDLDFYDPRVQTLTPAEQDVLLAGAECPYPPLIVADINARVGKSPENINVLLGRLVSAGVLYRVRKGQYRYTAPRFHEYLTRRAERAPE